MKTIKLISRSAAQTKRIGRILGKYLQKGDVVALEGGLGAGKTTMVKGIAAGLGFKKEKAVASPTFVIMHEYQGREPIRHLDWYRLAQVSGPDAQLAEESFESAVTLIEWPEKGGGLLPSDAWRVAIGHRGAGSRTLRLSVPEREGLVEELSR